MVSLHHYEVASHNISRRVAQFKTQFGFKVFGHQLGGEPDEGVALFINSVVMVIKKLKSVSMETSHTHTDWISDIVMQTTDFERYDRLNQRVMEYDRTDTQSTIQTHSHAAEVPANGMGMSLFRVKTPFPSVHHTVMYGKCNCVKDKGWTAGSCDNHVTITCLPGGYSWCPLVHHKHCHICHTHFGSAHSNVPRNISHVDHVTFACHANTSNKILQWYEKCMGFKRFRINTAENEDGFIIQGYNGMRMLAMEYWQCSEVAVGTCDKDKSIQFVFAEPLPNSGLNQVQRFLDDNSGPGVQHIAFYTDDIIGSVSCLRGNQVPFISPPLEYYTLFDKLEEIEKTKENVKLLQENNILIDLENGEDIKPNYLMQVFSQPLFERDTFFIEIIQRCGAKGFGAGNITALWKALELHLASSN